MRWLKRLAADLDLSINDESELRGVVKGMALGLLLYCGILIVVTLAAGGGR